MRVLDPRLRGVAIQRAWFRRPLNHPKVGLESHVSLLPNPTTSTIRVDESPVSPDTGLFSVARWEDGSRHRPSVEKIIVC